MVKLSKKIELQLKLDDLERAFYKQCGKTDLLFDLLMRKVTQDNNLYPMLDKLYKDETSKQQDIFVKLQKVFSEIKELENEKSK